MQGRLPEATLSRNQKASTVQVEAGMGRGEAVSVEEEAQENPMDGETYCSHHLPVLEKVVQTLTTTSHHGLKRGRLQAGCHELDPGPHVTTC